MDFGIARGVGDFYFCHEIAMPPERSVSPLVGDAPGLAFAFLAYLDSFGSDLGQLCGVKVSVLHGSPDKLLVLLPFLFMAHDDSGLGIGRAIKSRSLFWGRTLRPRLRLLPL